MNEECCGQGQTSNYSFPVHGLEYEHQHCACSHTGSWISHGLFPVGLMSSDRCTRSIMCHYHKNICSGTTLSVMYFCSGLWQVVMCCVTIGHQQACSGYTPFSLMKEISHKHPLVKWWRLFSLNQGTLASGLHIMQWHNCCSLQACQLMSGTNIWVNWWHHPAAQQCPSWWSHWTPCNGRCLSILDIFWLTTFVVFMPLSYKRKPLKVIHSHGMTTAGGCGWGCRSGNSLHTGYASLCISGTPL